MIEYQAGNIHICVVHVHIKDMCILYLLYKARYTKYIMVFYYNDTRRSGTSLRKSRKGRDILDQSRIKGINKLRDVASCFRFS